jgi:hypothetical protein
LLLLLLLLLLLVMLVAFGWLQLLCTACDVQHTLPAV